MEQESKKTKKIANRVPYRFYLLALVLLLVVVGGGYFGYRYWQNRQASPEVQAAKAEEEKQKILGQLGKLMILPAGDPVLFKVSNQEVMRTQQAFFKDTKNDDVLLVFQEGGKAILFRPSEGIIVNSGPVNFDQNQATKSTTASTTKTK
jgi:hypothetical protein